MKPKMTTLAQLENHSEFHARHIGPDEHEIAEMLEVVGAPSLDGLVDAIVPKSIKLASGLTAEFIEGTVPGPTTSDPSTGFQLYLLLRPQTHRLYELSFRIDARGLSQATLFRSIADHFELV